MKDKPDEHLEFATFAGGCFWCMGPPFTQIPGVVEVVAGYTGGRIQNPIYEEVCSGTTGHREAVRVAYDPDVVTYDRLLDVFWRQIDPTDPGGQFCDRGENYQTAIFYHNERQKETAEASKTALENSRRFSRPIVTKVLPAPVFFPAEEYHQDYHHKNPDNYHRYRSSSGRDEFIAGHWSPKKPDTANGSQEEGE